MSSRWSRKLPCLCQHSPAPTERNTATSEGKFLSMDSSSPRRKGRAESKRVWRVDGEDDGMASVRTYVRDQNGGLKMYSKCIGFIK